MTIIKRRRIADETKSQFIQAHGYEWVLRTHRISETTLRWRHILREYPVGWHLLAPSNAGVVRLSLGPEATEGQRLNTAFSFAVMVELIRIGYSAVASEDTYIFSYPDGAIIDTEAKTINEVMETLAVLALGIDEHTEVDMKVYLDSVDRIVVLLKEISKTSGYSDTVELAVDDWQERSANILHELGLPA